MTDEPAHSGGTGPSQAANRGCPRWAQLLLGLSLAVNLLIAGLVIGARLSHAPEAPGMRATGLAPIAGALDRRARHALSRELAERGGELARARGELRQATRALVRTLRDPDAGQAEIAAALARLRASLGHLQAVAHGALAEALARLSPEERASLADALERRLARRRRP